MTAAWGDRPTKKGEHNPIGTPLPRTVPDAAGTHLLTILMADPAGSAHSTHVRVPGFGGLGHEVCAARS